jgi:hypothetical protein
VNIGIFFRFSAAATLFVLAFCCRIANAYAEECSHFPDGFALPDMIEAAPAETPGAASNDQQNPNNRENEDQTRSIPISAPGTDANVFVPGSTVDTFGQFRFFRLGKVLLRPSGRGTYTYESNLLNKPANEISDQFYAIEPTIEAFLPIAKNGIRLDYSAAYRDYRKFPLQRKWSHTLNFDSLIDLSPLISVAIRDHFLVSSLDSREFVPGREILFSDARFKRNDVGAQMDWALGESNTLALSAGWNSLWFEDAPSQGITPFYDYDQFRFGASFRREVTQRTGIFVDGNYLRTVTDDPRNITDSKGFETVAGVSTFLTPLTSGQFSVGVRRDKYPHAGNQDFFGPVFRGAVLKEFTENSRLAIAFSRTKNLSEFQRNAYYMTHGVGISYVQDLGSKVTFMIAPGYQRNAYHELLIAEPGVPADMVGKERRLDQLLDLQASMRFRCAQWLAFELFFDAVRRYSNLPSYDFTNYRVGGSLLVGERGITRGRMFY